MSTVSIGCGGSASQNCTYFESSGTPSAGQCSAQVSLLQLFTTSNTLMGMNI